MTNSLNGGSFNLKFGRDKAKVKAEVERLLDKHGLDFLVVQEAVDYWNLLHHIDGYTYFSDREQSETGILVKETRKASRPTYKSFGDGWIAQRGGKHKPNAFHRVTVEWLRVGAIHMPTPIYFNEHGVYGPGERVDDYMALAKKAYNFFRIAGKRSRIIVGDWNEPPSTRTKWSPQWIANKVGCIIVAPKSREGHGIIDYPMGKNVELVNVRKDLDIKEGSDHEPVVFTVRKRQR